MIDYQLRDFHSSKINFLFENNQPEIKGYRNKIEVNQKTKEIKRGLLGVCGIESKKTLDEIANIFIKAKIAKEMNEARYLVNEVVNRCKKDERIVLDQKYKNLLYSHEKRLNIETGNDGKYHVSARWYKVENN